MKDLFKYLLVSLMICGLSGIALRCDENSSDGPLVSIHRPQIDRFDPATQNRCSIVEESDSDHSIWAAKVYKPNIQIADGWRKPGNTQLALNISIASLNLLSTTQLQQFISWAIESSKASTPPPSV